VSIRQTNWNVTDGKHFDVVIIGGGINGASVYHRLCQQGYKVLLIDKGDFSCGTSQASAMMIWGGLLYLKNLDFLSVYNFSNDRDVLLDICRNQMSPQYFRYISNNRWGRNKYFVYFALQLYWLLGKCRRERPRFQREYAEHHLVNGQNDAESLVYQEGFLKYSDSRFVLDWIIGHQTEDSFALNYCGLYSADYNNRDKVWHLELGDCFSARECTVSTRMVLNCAGVWTDDVNQQFGIKSPFKHIFSKGVFIGYERPKGHDCPLVFEMGENGDILSLIPWGPVSLWGPTETMESSIESGRSILREDITFLMTHASRNLSSSLTDSKIISLRCGLRPLAVEKSFKSNCYPLDISRFHRIAEDNDLPWMSVYGGKISGCLSMAERVAKRVSAKISPGANVGMLTGNNPGKIRYDYFPGLDEKVPAIDWCVSNEFCCTLEDYLRRRTNISQWTPREGLGFKDVNVQYLEGLATRLPVHERNHCRHSLPGYMDAVHRNFDALIPDEK